MKGSKTFIVCIFLMIVQACKKSDLSPEEYKKWLSSDESVRKVKDMGKYQYTLTFLPSAWMAYTRKEGSVNDTLPDEMFYFKLEIDAKDGKANLLKNDLQAKEEYFERLYYVSYVMKDDIRLMTSGQDYPCLLYHYERAYDLSSKLSFLLGFKKPLGITGDVVVEIMPRYFSDIEIKFKFKKDAIESVPKLKLDE